MTLRFPAGLYGVTPEWDDTDRLVAAVRTAAEGGLRALQLRRKNASPELRAAQARALAPLCRELGVVFLVNDHWRLALDIGADGAHLGRDDGDLAEARATAGAGFVLGASCYNELDRARQLLDAGADYIAFGAVYVSPTKPQAVQAPLSLLAQARDLASAHAGNAAQRAAVVAIGGITPARAPEVARAGADSIAVITGLFEAPDILAAARTCAAAFNP
jgi:thiamine-phosphate pyrophosphorylase